MKFTVNWIKEYVDLPTVDPVEISDVLAGLGFATESMHSIESQFRGVVVARVASVAKHPDADRLRIVRLDDGTAETEVVCGAWNFEAEAVVAWAQPGSVLAGGLEVGEREIRGVNSPGMVASERELGLGEDHEGILVLDGDAEIGSDFGHLVPYPDTVIDVEVNPNRPDCMSVLGLARELAAYYGVDVRPPEISVPESGAPTEVTVAIKDAEGCPRFVAREVRGVTIGPSPLWLRLRLEAVGVRSINNVVDATNFAMLELGHPTHAFDRDLLGEEVVVRRAQGGETLRTLDGTGRELDPTDMVVADGSRAVALAGVMGGEDTEVNDNTVNVLVEAAYWDPASILFTAARHGVHSEASSRFQRGADPNGARDAADRVAMLLGAHASGAPAPDAVDAYPKLIDPWTVEFPISEVERVTGTALDREEVVGHLESLGFGAAAADPLIVTVPTRRPDVTRAVDLVEEVARLHGYDNFPDSVATGPGSGIPVSEQRYRQLRQVMVGAGFHETMSFSFIGQQDLDRLALPSDDPRRRVISVIRPLREEEGVMRTTLLPGLLKAAANNVSRRVLNASLFETGKVFLPGGTLPQQPEALAFVASGATAGSWVSEGRARDALDATGTWEVLAEAMGVDYELRQSSPPAFHPQRAVDVVVDGEVVGSLGELHPNVAAAFGLEGRVAVGEVIIDSLLADPGLWQFREVSVFPPVIFDMAFELPTDSPASQVLSEIEATAGELLEEAVVFDEFSGPPLAEGRKSIAVRLSFRALDRTLTDAEVAPIRDAISEAVAAATGGRLRSG
jgi:phenylalanyl-tRNA synthetase beta chain